MSNQSAWSITKCFNLHIEWNIHVWKKAREMKNIWVLPPTDLKLYQKYTSILSMPTHNFFYVLGEIGNFIKWCFFWLVAESIPPVWLTSSYNEVYIHNSLDTKTIIKTVSVNKRYLATQREFLQKNYCGNWEKIIKSNRTADLKTCSSLGNS